MEQTKHLERYCAPTSLDIALFGTIAKVIISENEHELYIQLSQDEKMRWERLGSFFEEVFNEEFISNENFMENCLEMFKDLKKKVEESNGK